MKEQSYKREPIVCIIVAILGWFFLSIILEPLTLWRGLYVRKHTEVETTKTLATVAAVISGVAIVAMVIVFFIALSNN